MHQRRMALGSVIARTKQHIDPIETAYRAITRPLVYKSQRKCFTLTQLAILTIGLLN